MLTFLMQTRLVYARGIINQYSSDREGGWQMPLSGVSVKVREYARPGEKLAVWGWRCDYYVQTQMVQGVVENHTIHSVFSHFLQEFTDADIWPI